MASSYAAVLYWSIGAFVGHFRNLAMAKRNWAWRETTHPCRTRHGLRKELAASSSGTQGETVANRLRIGTLNSHVGVYELRR